MQISASCQPGRGDPREIQSLANAFESGFNHDGSKNTSECVLQAPKHILMGRGRAMMRRMPRSPDERREILRRFMNERGLKTASWAKQSSVSANSIYNFLNGHSDSLDQITYAKLARTAQVPIWKLNGDEPEAPSPTSIWVVGSVEAGKFREAVEWDRSLWYAVDVPIEERFRRKAKALEVRGPSMNLEYPDRSLVIWVPMLDIRPPRDQDHVIVYMHMVDGTIEATVKELRVTDDGRRWLWPRSSHPEHQSPVNVETPGDDVTLIEIVGLVIGGYKPRFI